MLTIRPTILVEDHDLDRQIKKNAYSFAKGHRGIPCATERDGAQ